MVFSTTKQKHQQANQFMKIMVISGWIVLTHWSTTFKRYKKIEKLRIVSSKKKPRLKVTIRDPGICVQ